MCRNNKPTQLSALNAIGEVQNCSFRSNHIADHIPLLLSRWCFAVSQALISLAGDWLEHRRCLVVGVLSLQLLSTVVGKKTECSILLCPLFCLERRPGGQYALPFCDSLACLPQMFIRAGGNHWWKGKQMHDLCMQLNQSIRCHFRHGRSP